MNDLSYSILLPVYQVEAYLQACLESIIHQTYPYFEVILVIDGSKDRSAEIAYEYARKDTRFHVIEQENQGLLKTRLRLVELAKNEICVFVDPDDTIEPNLLESINPLFMKQKCDMVCYRFNRVTNSGRIYMKDWNLFSDNTLFTKENKSFIWDKFLSSNRLNHVWSKAFKKSILDPSVFAHYPNVYGEDVLLSMYLIHNAKRIGYRDLTLYNYRNSTNGLGRNFKLKHLDDSEYVRKEVYEFIRKIGVLNSNSAQKYFTSYIKSTLRNIRLLSGHSIQDEIIKRLECIKIDPLFIQSKAYLNQIELNSIDKLYLSLFLHHRFKLLIQLCKLEDKFRKRLKRIVRK